MMGVSLPPAIIAALRAFASARDRGISYTVRALLKASPDPEWQKFLAASTGELDSLVSKTLADSRAKAKEREAAELRKALADPFWNPAKAAHRRRELAAGRPDPYEPVADDDSDDDVEI